MLYESLPVITRKNVAHFVSHYAPKDVSAFFPAERLALMFGTALESASRGGGGSRGSLRRPTSR